MSCLCEVQTISKSPHILPMPSLTRLTTGGVLNPLKNTTKIGHNKLLHQEPLQPPLEPSMENISVTGEFGRKPALAFDGTPSDELVVEVLRAGDGQEVEAGDTITCHYYGAVFGSATDFDNSFDRGGALSFQIGVGMVIPGWDEGLVGKRVGDRVLLSIPAELGYGARGVPQAGIPGGATLVFVTDILGVN